MAIQREIKIVYLRYIFPHYVFATLACLLLIPFNFSMAETGTTKIVAGKVIMSVGDVTAESLMDELRHLNRRSHVYVGDTITTAAGGRVQIRFNDGAIVSLRESTQFKITEYSHQQKHEDSVVLELLKGGFKTITGKVGRDNREAYQVTTPVSSIGIRGTNYEIVMESHDAAVAAVWTGGITVENEFGKINLGFDADFNFARTVLGSAPIGLLEPPPLLDGQLVPLQGKKQIQKTKLTKTNSTKTQTKVANSVTTMPGKTRQSIETSNRSDVNEQVDAVLDMSGSNDDGASELSQAESHDSSSTALTKAEQLVDELIAQLQIDDVVANSGEQPIGQVQAVIEQFSSYYQYVRDEDIAELELSEGQVEVLRDCVELPASCPVDAIREVIDNQLGSNSLEPDYLAENLIELVIPIPSNTQLTQLGMAAALTSPEELTCIQLGECEAPSNELDQLAKLGVGMATDEGTDGTPIVAFDFLNTEQSASGNKPPDAVIKRHAEGTTLAFATAVGGFDISWGIWDASASANGEARPTFLRQNSFDETGQLSDSQVRLLHEPIIFATINNEVNLVQAKQQGQFSYAGNQHALVITSEGNDYTASGQFIVDVNTLEISEGSLTIDNGGGGAPLFQLFYNGRVIDSTAIMNITQTGLEQIRGNVAPQGVHGVIQGVFVGSQAEGFVQGFSVYDPTDAETSAAGYLLLEEQP